MLCVLYTYNISTCIVLYNPEGSKGMCSSTHLIYCFGGIITVSHPAALRSCTCRSVGPVLYRCFW